MPGRAWVPLLRLVALLLVAGAALLFTAGPPRLPTELPGIDEASAVLRGSSVPLEGLGFAIASLAWLVWAWLSLSVVLRIGIALADVATRGATWVGQLRRASDFVTLPVVRRAVDGALAVAMVVQVAAHAAPASAAPISSEPTAIVQLDHASVRPTERRFAEYTVQPGDTLFSIAERFYGNGDEFVRVRDANVGRPMGEGAVFPPTGVIEPGWTLHVPLTSTSLDVEDGHVWYTVEKDDTLWDISERYLGDPLRWPEVFELNRESAALTDGRTLRNPHLIWPELRVRLPLSAAVEQTTSAPLQPSPAVPSPEAPPPAPPEPAAASLAPAPAVASSNDMMMGAGALGVAGLAATAVALRMRRRSLLEPPIGDEPESEAAIRGGFADLDDLAHALAGAAHARLREPVEGIAHEVQRVLEEKGLAGGVGVVSVRHGRSSTSVALVTQRLADRPRVLALAAAIGSRLGVEARGQLSRDHDVLLRLTGATRARFAASGITPATTGCRLLPCGILPDRQVLYLNWSALGHVLVGGRSRPAVAAVLSALVTNLAARSRPEELQLLTLANDDVLPAALARLPHQSRSAVNVADEVARASALNDVRGELLRRMERVERGASASGLPEIVAVVGELSQLVEHTSTLELLGTYGPAHRVRLVAATSSPRDLPDTLLPHFPTRLVLRVADDVESARLLGSPAAVDLLGGGQMLVRLDAREPLEAYAFRVPEAELERVVRVLSGEAVDLTPAAAAPFPIEAEALDPIAPPISAVASIARAPARTEDVREPAVHVRCFGGFEVRAGPVDLTLAASPAEAGQRARAWELLAYLGSCPEGVAGYDDLLPALWRDISPTHALADLHAIVEQINALLEIEGGRTAYADDREQVCRLDLTCIASDVHAFARLSRAASMMPAEHALSTLQRARELYRGDLLDGPGARTYAWVVAPTEDGGLSPRDHYRELYLRATMRQARLLLMYGQPAEAEPLLRHLLEAEPDLEDVRRDLEQAKALQTDRQPVAAS